MQNRTHDTGHNKEGEKNGRKGHAGQETEQESPVSSELPSFQKTNPILSLHRLSSKMLTLHTVDDLLAEVSAEIRKGLGYDGVAICLTDESGRKCEFRAPTENIQTSWRLREKAFPADEMKILDR